MPAWRKYPNEMNGTIILGHRIGVSLSSRPCAYVGDRERRICGCYASLVAFIFSIFPRLYAVHSRGLLLYVHDVRAFTRIRLAFDCSRRTSAVCNSATRK